MASVQTPAPASSAHPAVLATPVPTPVAKKPTWYAAVGAEVVAFLKGETYVHGYILVAGIVLAFIAGRLI